MDGKYVYCVIKADGEETFSHKGFEGREVYPIVYKDLAAVVSDSSVMEYEATDENILEHVKIASMVMEGRSVLPVAYGMVFKNKKVLLLTMKKAMKAMRKAFKTTENKVELGIKVIRPKGFEGGDGFVEECRSEFQTALAGVAAQTKHLRLFSDRLIMNCAFLVDRDNIGDFSHQVGVLEPKYSPLKVQYSGPWPPYNFVDIKILGKQKGGFRQ